MKALREFSQPAGKAAAGDGAFHHSMRACVHKFICYAGLFKEHLRSCTMLSESCKCLGYSPINYRRHTHTHILYNKRKAQGHIGSDTPRSTHGVLVDPFHDVIVGALTPLHSQQAHQQRDEVQPRHTLR